MSDTNHRATIRELVTSYQLLIEERDQLQKKLEATKGKAICIYCLKVHSYKTPEEQKALTEHILSCEKNPVLQMAKEACDKADQWREMADRLASIPIAQSSLSIEALAAYHKLKQGETKQ